MIIDVAPLKLAGTSPRWISAIFEAPWVSAESWYDFTLPANLNRDFLPLAASSKYLVSSMTMVANVPEAGWLQGLPAANGPQLIFGSQQNRGTWLRDSVSLASYWRHGPMRLWYETQGATDTMQLSVGGQILGNSLLVGVDPLRIVVTLEIYEVADGSFHLQSPFLAGWNLIKSLFPGARDTNVVGS